MEFPRTLVIGIDGATFDLIKPWAEAGLLPTFAHLLKHGAHSTLDAYPYMNSAAAWTNIITGHNPGKHSIFGFTMSSKDKPFEHPTSGHDRHKPPFWHILAAGGQRVGVMNVPITFPAEDINGFMVSGMDTPHTNSRGFSSPDGIYQELRRAGIEYVIDAPNMGQAARQGYNGVPPAIRDMTFARTRSFLYLLEKYPCDAAMLVYIGSDRMSHYFWRESPPAADAPEWKPLRDLFVLYDTQLQELLQHAGSETTIFILSDHGFGTVHTGYYGVNAVMQQLGYQAGKKRPSQARVLGSLMQVGRRTIPQRWQRKLAMRFPLLHSRAALSNKQGSFDWSRTRAYAQYSGSLRINSVRRNAERGIVSEAEYDALWQELAGVMSALTNPETGHPLVSRIHRPEEFYSGPFVLGGADLLTRWNHKNLGNTLAYRRNGHDIVVHPKRPTNEWIGTHYPNGVFIAYGKGIRSGTVHAPISHFELAPTLLYLHDQPIAEDMDGRVLTDWLEPEMLARHVVKKQAASEYVSEGAALGDDENEMVENRLRSLGYIA